MNQEVTPKQEVKSKSMFDSLLDSVLSVPETVVNGLADLAITSLESVDEMVSGVAKSLANVIIPDKGPTSQPSKA